MGWTVLYIAFGVVALWLLGEVLLQYKARLRWRLLAFFGFLGVVFGVLLPSVLVIAVGTVGFAAGQTFVTLSFRRGFSTGWALGGQPGTSRRRREMLPSADPDGMPEPDGTRPMEPQGAEPSHPPQYESAYEPPREPPHEAYAQQDSAVPGYPGQEQREQLEQPEQPFATPAPAYGYAEPGPESYPADFYPAESYPETYAQQPYAETYTAPYGESHAAPYGEPYPAPAYAGVQDTGQTYAGHVDGAGWSGQYTDYGTQQEQQAYPPPPAYPADVGNGQWPAAQPYQQEAVPSGDVWMPQQREAVPPSEYDYSQSPPQPYPYQDGQDAGSGYYYNDQQQRY